MFTLSFFDSDSAVISKLYTLNISEAIKLEVCKLKQEMLEKGRKELEEKLSTAFGGKISGLSPELQEILLDDMVTAFENRLKVLIKVSESDDN
jgi:hypothetical protein